MRAVRKTDPNSRPRPRECFGARTPSTAETPKRPARKNIRSDAKEGEESPASPITARIADVPSCTRDKTSIDAIFVTLQPLDSSEHWVSKRAGRIVRERRVDSSMNGET